MRLFQKHMVIDGGG